MEMLLIFAGLTVILGFHYYMLSLFKLCLGVEKSIFKEMTHMTYMATPRPAPGGHKIYNLGRPYLGHHYFVLSLSDL